MRKTKNSRLSPDNLSYLEVHQQMNGYTAEQFETHLNNLENDQKKCAALGTGNDKFPDAWLVVRTLNDERWVLFIQSKRHRDGERALEPVGSITEEHKCKFCQDNHTFIYISDARGREDKKRGKEEPISYKNNEIVVTHKSHDVFYGKCLSLRKAHMM
jgi:hypothetical protein